MANKIDVSSFPTGLRQWLYKSMCNHVNRLADISTDDFVDVGDSLPISSQPIATSTRPQITVIDDYKSCALFDDDIGSQPLSSTTSSSTISSVANVDQPSTQQQSYVVGGALPVSSSSIKILKVDNSLSPVVLVAPTISKEIQQQHAARVQLMIPVGKVPVSATILPGAINAGDKYVALSGLKL
jgi:hypothetical protein